MVDFVITWVDGSDKEWLKEKNKYLDNPIDIDDRIERYRDMDLLKYWFRGVEKYASWVNKIYFVTCGQKPDWLNENNPKLVLVNHKDYMKSDSIPTFNSNAIEVSMHKIKGLNEQFVYFNDDQFIIDYINETDYFKDNKPVDMMSLDPVRSPKKSNIENINGFHYVKMKNIDIINKYFDFKECIRKNRSKYLSTKQGKFLHRTLVFMEYDSFLGFKDQHMPIPFLKSTFEEVWSKEYDLLNNTLHTKFRNNYTDMNLWLFRYWNFAKGNFYQQKCNFGKYFKLSDNCYNHIVNHKSKVICINDVPGDYDFDLCRENLRKAFDKILSEKSSFEK